MQFSIIAITAAVAGIASANPAALDTRATVGSQQIKWDPNYDDPKLSLNNVACSNGIKGLAPKWPTLGNIPYFDSGLRGWGVVATPDVAGWNSPNCGLCYNINYGGRNAWVIAVDHGAPSFNVGHKVLDYLTNGRATELGTITATVTTMACPDYWKN